MLVRIWRKEIPDVVLVGMYIATDIEEKNMEVSEKKKNDNIYPALQPYSSAIHLLGIHLNLV